MPFTTTKPVGQFTDINGKPLDGQVFFGQPNLDPIANPITVYWDAAGTQPVTQPVVTVGGYPMNGSTRSNVFVNADYSILVRNRNGFTVFSAPNLPFEDSSDNQYFLQAGSGAVQRTVQSKLRDVVSVKDFGADSTGVTDSATAFTNAIATGKAVYIPEGTYRVDSTISVPDGMVLYGEGRRQSIIKSYVVAGPLFAVTTDDVAFAYIADLKLEGNGLSGASGNGHALSLIDPVAGGAWSPQNCVFERLWISGFKGTDDADRGGVTKVASAGVMLFQALAITLRNIYVSNCGHGIYLDDTQNCRVNDCVTDGTTKYGLFAVRNDNLIVDSCDFVNAGDGVADAGYPFPNLESGVVGSFYNSSFVLRSSKVKNNYAGRAAVVSKFSNGDLIDSCWLRGDAETNVQHTAIFAQESAGLRVLNNTFSPSTTLFAQNYKTIDILATQTADTFLVTIQNNTFESVSGKNIDFNIRLLGNNSARTVQAIITGNQFGESAAVSSASTVTNDILISTCTLQNSVIANNKHYAATNVTRTACVAFSSVTSSNNTVGPSTFVASGGTLTADYSGVTNGNGPEQGTWSPTLITSGTNFASVTYDGVRGGRYIKIGNLVHVQATMRTDAIDTTGATGTVLIGGLPYPVAANSSGKTDSSSVWAIGYADSFAGDVPCSISTVGGTSTARLWYRTAANGATTALAIADVGTGANANYFEFSGSYITG